MILLASTVSSALVLVEIGVVAPGFLPTYCTFVNCNYDAGSGVFTVLVLASQRPQRDAVARESIRAGECALFCVALYVHPFSNLRSQPAGSRSRRVYRSFGGRASGPVAGGAPEASENQRAVRKRSAPPERRGRFGSTGRLEQPQPYRDASPIEKLPLGVRQEFFAGRMFAAQAPAYEEAAKRAGDTIDPVVMPAAGHFVFVNPGSAVWPQVVKSTRALHARIVAIAGIWRFGSGLLLLAFTAGPCSVSSARKL